MTALRILVVDDEPLVVEVVQHYLEREGFTVDTACSGPAGLAVFRACRPSLVVLDVMLPGLSGLEICRIIQSEAAIPVILLTARGAEMDRIAGFEVGADDYLAKPFSPRELVARVKAVLRRAASGDLASVAPMVFSGDITLDPRARSVTLRTVPVALSMREFDLLAYLISRPRQVMSRAQLLESVWGEGWYGDASTVTVHVRRLRTKLERDPERPEHLRTVWGVGYRWDP